MGPSLEISMILPRDEKIGLNKNGELSSVEWLEIFLSNSSFKLSSS